jgi:hypothetical protein
MIEDGSIYLEGHGLMILGVFLTVHCSLTYWKDTFRFIIQTIMARQADSNSGAPSHL